MMRNAENRLAASDSVPAPASVERQLSPAALVAAAAVCAVLAALLASTLLGPVAAPADHVGPEAGSVAEASPR